MSTLEQHQTPLPANYRLHRYHIQRQLGKGGFGITYLALDTERNRSAVIKGGFKPNPYGLYDMLGNVWGWSCLGYDERYSGGENQCQNRVDSGGCALRGGSWFGSP
ncbi:hypothetical protein D5085_10115 [Ectothiorhodospiraceae bacterium BW-2]|nr:hypothetical protein D5085_10115 [Ectothiorhodospiraceae bacterium BW-2]